MGIKDIIKKSFLEGYATSDIQISTILICIISTVLIASYIYFIYKSLNKNSYYNQNFNLSLVALAVITAAIILTIQSNIVVSLGMVGALSIVRFRTAIKDPMDLVFLFWSISIGIICGAGFTMIAIITSIVLTIAILLLSLIPESQKALVLVVNASHYDKESEILAVVDKYCHYARTRARNVTKTNLNMAIEVKVENPKVLIERLMSLEYITTASLVEYDGDVTV